MSFTARARDTRLLAIARKFESVGGALLLSGTPGSGYITLTGGDQILISGSQSQKKTFTFFARRRDTNFISTTKTGL